MRNNSINRFMAAAFIIAALFTAGRAQNCKKLAPAGAGLDDAGRINQCLATKGRAKLKAGTFLLYGPVLFPRDKNGAEVSGVKLEGKGMDSTKLAVMFDCESPRSFVTQEAPGRYISPIQAVRSPAAAIINLELDVSRLRRDCGYLGTHQISVNRSPGSEVSGVRIKGSKYGSADYTSGGANGGGILVLNSEASLVTDNEITDVGFMFEVNSLSAGFSGIAVESSANTKVQNNKITRVAFGITVVNGAPELGYTGNSSGTVVTNNQIVGAGNINCPDCSQGRAIKLQACGTGSEPPLENIVVSNNVATEFGGANGSLAGSGLDLVCGVRYSTFDGNTFIGAANAEFGLQIRSSFLSPVNPTHHNTFSFNRFSSGRGQLPCADHCSDVHFTPDGPDQIGMRRNGNDRSGTNQVTNFRVSSDRGCNDYGHAFYLYLGETGYLKQGEELLLAATGVRPGSTVTFRLVREEDGSEAAVFRSRRVNNNCIMNQELLQIDPALFSPGYYKVFADYQDGNTSNVFITGDLIGTIRVKKNKAE
jgi:hypothetical protein